MSLYKRGDVWWYKFRFAGRVIRESSKSESKTVAKDAERIPPPRVGGKLESNQAAGIATHVSSVQDRIGWKPRNPHLARAHL